MEYFESIYKKWINKLYSLVILKLKNANFTNSPISINNIDINKIVVSNKISCGKKNLKSFIGYKYVRPFFILLPKMSTYRIDFDETKCMFFYKR